MNTDAYTLIAEHAQAVGTQLWRRLAACRHVAVTAVTLGNEFDAYLTFNVFHGVYVNGHECTVSQSPYHRLNLPPAGEVDAVVVLSLELYAGVDDVCLRPVPPQWRARMNLTDDVEVVHVHVCAADDDPRGVYAVVLAHLNGVDTLTQLRAEGVYVGYSVETSLNPSLPL